ncbi:MAG TPA: bifunctional 5,10-methylenetetrahydrofolate dehydrogenase/5,10-methenyltetrahydrofolate cyclohydrolase [Bacteroidales bacterium]|jgi:methylenetetrahydrofolate dehydrogenase (NADP+)/methenyltetrahydrofolate cyclohydrolase|nr:bifunctional 5,10-methylenetetrahydrofolate dehydrogenase/5,10-methenyltetrahydrofolate cyclohydrolase [Bacteroidales bacterium]HPU47334.1 bifunctional 5,10-methylenetetrahydrofolate dehydrogenase/5,10-methenyltetrahydrofolate cyclohydrolase [Bacteroidales bacterium]
MNILDGKATAEQIKEEIKAQVAHFIDDGLRPPHLAAVLVGNNPASETYVRNKEKNSKLVGFTSSVYNLPIDTSENELLKVIGFLNDDPDIDGFIVQLPLPQHINEEKIINTINPKKDVDGFHPINVGKMVLGIDTYLPATPSGIIELLKRNNIETTGKHAVIIGRSNIVGTPLSILLSRKNDVGNCTVTLCHSQTPNIQEFSLQADILVAAIGKPAFVKADMVKDGAIVIDVGINTVPDNTKKSGYRTIGDVDFDEVSKKASWITPVPGGIGPMTIVSLLMNTLKAYKYRFNLT